MQQDIGVDVAARRGRRSEEAVERSLLDEVRRWSHDEGDEDEGEQESGEDAGDPVDEVGTGVGTHA